MTKLFTKRVPEREEENDDKTGNDLEGNHENTCGNDQRYRQSDQNIQQAMRNISSEQQVHQLDHVESDERGVS